MQFITNSLEDDEPKNGLELWGQDWVSWVECEVNVELNVLVVFQLPSLSQPCRHLQPKTFGNLNQSESEKLSQTATSKLYHRLK